MKTIVLGPGFLGTRIAAELRCILSHRNALDISSLRSYLDKERPDVVINAVGKTGRPNIDWCEDHKEETMQSNVVAATNLCLESVKRGIYFVHLGSGCLYQGDNDGKGYGEEDKPNCHGQFYGRTKILAENILKEFPCLQLRLRMPIDDRPHPRNFVDKVKHYPRVINAQNSMTILPDMISALRLLIERRKTGIYNCVNPGAISAAEVMQMYKEIVDPGHNFEVFSVRALAKSARAKRCNCILNTDKLKAEGIEMPEIHQAVRDCLVSYREYLR